MTTGPPGYKISLLTCADFCAVNDATLADSVPGPELGRDVHDQLSGAGTSQYEWLQHALGPPRLCFLTH